MKKISIISINYNNCIGLEKTINSVVSQTASEIEFIIIDGGSNDGSVELIKKYQHKITQWVSEKDQGIYYAQNKGIQMASGDYCLFLNSGDFLCDEKVIQNVMDLNLDKDIVYGNMKINWGNNLTSGLMPETIDLKHMLMDTIWHPVAFIKRSLFAVYGNYDVSYRMVADYDFFFKVVIAHHCSTKHIPVFIVEYSTDGLSSDPSKKNIETEERKRVISSYLSADETKKALKFIKRKNSPFMDLLNYLKTKLN